MFFLFSTEKLKNWYLSWIIQSSDGTAETEFIWAPGIYFSLMNI